MLLIITLYALFGTSFSIGKVLLTNYTTPIFLAGSRFFPAGLILLAYQYFHPSEKFKFKRKHIWYYAQIIFFGVYFTYILRFWALSYLSSSKTALLFNLAPFLSSFYSYMFFKETMTKKQWIGLVIGFIGLIPIVLSSSPAESYVGEWFFISWPELAVIGAVAAHSYSWIVVRKLVKEKSYSPMMVNGISMTVGGFLALLTSFPLEGAHPVTDIGPFLFWLTAIIIISNIICHNLYGYLLKKYTATFLSFAGFMAPIFATLYGWYFLGETITWHFYVSGAIVFVGLILFYQDELKDKNAIPPDTAYDKDIVG